MDNVPALLESSLDPRPSKGAGPPGECSRWSRTRLESEWAPHAQRFDSVVLRPDSHTNRVGLERVSPGLLWLMGWPRVSGTVAVAL